jgi:hypothetical protein
MIIRRKPTKKEIFFGCMEFLKIMLIGFFTFNDSDMQMGWEFFKLTAQGKFETTEDSKETKKVREEWRKGKV